MTEKPSDIDPPAGAALDDERAAEPSVFSEPVDTAAPPPVASRPVNQSLFGRQSGKGLWLALFALLAVALAAALWYQRQEIDRLGRHMAGRIDAVATAADAATRAANQALALAQSQVAIVKNLQTNLDEIRSQYQALQDSWKPLGNGSGQVVLLNDVEQLLTQAKQQLRLGGNVSNAIIALEIAQARLARTDHPELTLLQQAIDTDLSSLRAVPMVDVPALAARVDRLITLIGRAPLLASDVIASNVVEPGSTTAASPTASPALPEDAPWWQRMRVEIASWPRRALEGLSHEMSDLINIRRVDDANALLLAPDQAAQLRAALRMRLLTAQLALLMRQPAVWQSELATVSAALASNYDAHSVDTATAVHIVRELGNVNVAVTLPDLGESLKAVAALRDAGGLTLLREE